MGAAMIQQQGAGARVPSESSILRPSLARSASTSACRDIGVGAGAGAPACCRCIVRALKVSSALVFCVQPQVLSRLTEEAHVLVRIFP